MKRITISLMVTFLILFSSTSFSDSTNGEEIIERFNKYLKRDHQEEYGVQLKSLNHLLTICPLLEEALTYATNIAIFRKYPGEILQQFDQIPTVFKWEEPKMELIFINLNFLGKMDNPFFPDKKIPESIQDKKTVLFIAFDFDENPQGIAINNPISQWLCGLTVGKPGTYYYALPFEKNPDGTSKVLLYQPPKEK